MDNLADAESLTVEKEEEEELPPEVIAEKEREEEELRLAKLNRRRRKKNLHRCREPMAGDNIKMQTLNDNDEVLGGFFFGDFCFKVVFHKSLEIDS